MKFKLHWSLRLAISLGLLALLVWWNADSGALLDAFLRVPPWLWVAMLAGFLTGHVVAAVKWWLLIGRAAGVGCLTCIRGHFAGQAANLFLPGVSGGDVVRLVWAMRQSRLKEPVAVAGVLDRLLDLAALLLLATIGGLCLPQWNSVVAQSLVTVAAVLVGGTLVAAAALYFLRHRFPHGLWARVALSVHELRREPLRTAGAFVLSLGVQSGFVLLNAWLGAAIGVDCSVAAWFLAWPLAKLVALVPVSINGLGVREMALVFFLHPLGGASDTAKAAGLTWASVMYAGGLIGGLFGINAVRPNASGLPAEPAVGA